MFAKLSLEKHNRQATKDHNKIIVESADETVPMGDDYAVSLSELDIVIGDGADSVSQQDVDDLENVIGQIADKDDSDITKMTADEISTHIDSVDNPAVSDLI